MKKDAYYFSHDSSASRDIKMLKLKHKHGWEGIGLFWGIIETLRESSEYKFQSDKSSIELLSTILGIDYAKLNSVIETCYEVELFTKDNKFFYSNSLNQRMQEMNIRRENGYKNGVLGGRPSKDETQTKPKNNLNNNLNETQTKPFKRKEKKEKEKKDAYAYFFSLGLSKDQVEQIKSFDAHQYHDWIEANEALFKPVERITLESGRKVSKPRLDVPNPFKWGYSANTGLPSINMLSEEQRERAIDESKRNGGVL